MSAGPLNALLVGDGALTGRCFSSPGPGLFRGSTALPLTDASSVGPLKEGFDLVGRLKYFLRLGSCWRASRTRSSLIALSKVPDTSLFVGPGNGQFARGAGVIASFDVSGTNGFLGLPHFWHEGPHLSRWYSGCDLKGPEATISDSGAASCEIRSGEALLCAVGTVRGSVLNSCEVGDEDFTQFDLEASGRSRS
jgi:hypothetical protein